ncbi:DUF1611 domain-containing protein [Pseudonocardia eucalypti]|uniref:DUF1611 domain-containing protein n=1 Tax=Pseudonocardia eucalypti TaxID=648755 RepID=A0ABP9RE35_9PSEU|nr:hypothetical protein [Pseudonocardia eucalypti]
MQRLSGAKWGYVTRRMDAGERDNFLIGGVTQEPRLGDFVVATVAKLGEHEALEDPHGRRARLYPGDMLVGAYGNRYATDFYEGYMPGVGDAVHLLTSGGLIGTVASSHTSRGEPTELEVIGALTKADGVPLNTEDFVAPAPAQARPELGTIVVLGSGMNAGKTTATAAIVRGLSRAGLKVGAGKVTGSGSGKDHWSYVDAGAAYVAEFLDFGMPSTFGYPVDRLMKTTVDIRDHLVARGADVVVLEVADGVLQDETRYLASQLPGFADHVVLAVGDALGAVAGIGVLAELKVPVRAVSGLVTASPLATREAAAATDLPVVSPAELAGGAAVDLLAEISVDDLAKLDGSPA